MLNTIRDVSDSVLPLLGPRDVSQPFARRGLAPISSESFLAAVHALAARLPDRPQVINYCEDRYHFIVALAAAMVRGQVTHLPNDRTSHALSHLTGQYPDIYCLVDTDPSPAGIRCVNVDSGETAHPSDHGIPAIPEEQIAAYVYTGGTTGVPSASIKTWGALVDGSWRIAKGIGLSDHTNATIIATVPAQHMYGLELSVMLPLTEGVTVHADRPLFPSDIERCVQESGGNTVLVTTPVHLKALVSGGARLTGVAKIVSATAPLSSALALQVEQRFGAPVIEIYGCSEAGSLASRRTISATRWRTLEGLSVDKKDDRWFAWVPYLPAAVPLQDIIDLVTPTEFELRGRTSDMVNVAGKRASLSGLTAILNDISGVEDGVFICQNSDGNKAVTRLSAFVVAPGMTPARLRQALSAKIDPVFMPRPLHLVESLPRTAAGKLTKSGLEELARSVRSAGR